MNNKSYTISINVVYRVVFITLVNREYVYLSHDRRIRDIVVITITYGDKVFSYIDLYMSLYRQHLKYIKKL